MSEGAAAGSPRDDHQPPASLLGASPLIELPGRRPPLPWRGWSARHGLAMTVLVPAAFLAFHAAIPSGVREGLGWMLAAGLLAVLAALVLATYVPRRGTRAASSRIPARPAGSSPTPCAAMAGVSVLVAVFLLGATPGPLGPVGALVILAFGLYQRTSGACGV